VTKRGQTAAGGKVVPSRAPRRGVARRRLLPHHQKALRAAAIADEVRDERGYFSATSRDDLPGGKLSKEAPAGLPFPALVIPVRDVQGRVALYQFRPDQPREDRKYERAAGTRNVLDVPRRTSRSGALGDPGVPLVVTEGSKKVDAATSAGLCCVALLGVDCWRGRNAVGGTTDLADWGEIALNGREVYLAFDADVTRNPRVRRALKRLRAFLRSRKADVRVITLPELPGAPKTGLDDYLAAGHTVAELFALGGKSLPTRAPAAPSTLRRRGPGLARTTIPRAWRF
jgi:Domain of unknown function (DUF3854)